MSTHSHSIDPKANLRDISLEICLLPSISHLNAARFPVACVPYSSPFKLRLLCLKYLFPVVCRISCVMYIWVKIYHISLMYRNGLFYRQIRLHGYKLCLGNATLVLFTYPAVPTSFNCFLLFRLFSKALVMLMSA